MTTLGLTSTIAARLRWWAVAGIGSELLATVAWVVGGLVSGPGYRPMRDDISDLGAVTAPHGWAFLTLQAVGGVVSVGFSLFALRPALAGAGRPGRWGPWLAAGSAVQNLTDAVFRLPCRTADGCTSVEMTAGWRAQVHELIGLVCLLLTIVAALVLAAAFRRIPAWRDLAVPTVALGVLVVVALFVVGAPQTATVHGLAQRILVVAGSVWGIWVAVRLFRLYPDTDPAAADAAGTGSSR